MAGTVTELKAEIQYTNMKIDRLEFERGLERQFWASKLKAKRRRVHRMRRYLEKRNTQLEESQVQLLETKRRNTRALRILAERGRLVFDKSLQIVSHLSQQLAERRLHRQAVGEEFFYSAEAVAVQSGQTNSTHFAGSQVLQA